MNTQSQTCSDYFFFKVIYTLTSLHAYRSIETNQTQLFLKNEIKK